MPHRTLILIALLAGVSYSLPNAGIIATAIATQTNSADVTLPTPGTLHGKVTDIIEAAGYTYAEVDTGETKVWAATTTTALKIGDIISFSTSMPMKDYHSKSLKRDFPLVYFSGQFTADTATLLSAPTAIKSPHEQVAHRESGSTIKKFDKADGGETIAELYAEKDKLGGKTVHVRGQVTKFTPNVMGSNWLHISDSSTQDDLTITTTSTDAVAIDDVVVIDGKLSLDKDFGYGYVYPIIVEEATIVKE